VAVPASYSLDTPCFSPEVKRPGSEAENSHPSSTENGGAIPPLHGVVLNKLSTETTLTLTLAVILWELIEYTD
jgi:hypothetical protein